ncbi:MAG: FMN-binding glutamate synthase family protein, partial [Myxococcales bacterium]|nr:FMN-binding glutamate synthase family protein [Myxococcales bacterium]
IGHFRYILEAIGPELRQYIVTDNDEERPFSRDQRRWVYASAKKENNYFGFGTDNDLENSPNYLIIKQSTFPKDDAHTDPLYLVPCAKVVGGPRGRRHAYRPESIVYTTAMSYGSLSAAAVEAINRGVVMARSQQNTGEGGISPHHDHGGDLIYQLGTGYFGARDEHGNFSMEKLKEKCQRYKVRAVELKLSQGAKPGRGGVLPGAKVTKEIAEIRHVPLGRDVISPPMHTAFRSADEMLDLVERIADETGRPVGIKSAVGALGFWEELAALMAKGDRGVDYIQIDGGEGGTGAAPLVFTDHVALPFKIGFSRVYQIFARHGLTDRVAFVGSGRLGFPAESLFAMGLGCDLIAVGREAMMAVGCIQAQRCHTGRCPTGVATQSKWLMRGLDPEVKSHRLANYLVSLRKELMWLTHACGYDHPAEVTLDDFEIVDECFRTRPPRELFGYEAGWGVPSAGLLTDVRRLMPS